MKNLNVQVESFWVTAYTDASFSTTRKGWAIWLRSNEGRVVKNGECVSSLVADSVGAELWAILRAIETTLKTWPQTTGIQINSDCESILKFLWPWSPSLRNSLHRQIQLQIQTLVKQRKIKVHTKHVKGHQTPNDIRFYLNNQVDKLAGVAKEIETITRGTLPKQERQSVKKSKDPRKVSKTIVGSRYVETFDDGNPPW